MANEENRAIKEPWLMTKEEFRNNDVRLQNAAARLQRARERLGNHRWGEARRFAGRRAEIALVNLDKATEGWSRAFDKAEQNHRKFVLQALSENKPIPQEVLEGYKDIN